MARKYFATMASHLVPVQGISASRGSWLYDMEGKEVDELVKKHPGTFTVLSKDEFETEKKMMSSSGSVTGSQPPEQPPAQPAEEAEVTEAEALKVSKVESVAKKKKK